jgi:hypothetical protein
VHDAATRRKERKADPSIREDQEISEEARAEQRHRETDCRRNREQAAAAGRRNEEQQAQAQVRKEIRQTIFANNFIAVAQVVGEEEVRPQALARTP